MASVLLIPSLSKFHSHQTILRYLTETQPILVCGQWHHCFTDLLTKLGTLSIFAMVYIWFLYTMIKTYSTDLLQNYITMVSVGRFNECDVSTIQLVRLVLLERSHHLSNSVQCKIHFGMLVFRQIRHQHIYCSFDLLAIGLVRDKSLFKLEWEICSIF